MALETLPWDAADHLDSEAMILAYLEAAFEDGDPELIATALNNVARAQGRNGASDLLPSADIGTLIRTVKSLVLELAEKAA